MMDLIMSSGSLGLVVAAFIFFVTLFLVAKRWIELSTTMVLLLFALASGLMISNQDFIREYLKGSSQEHVHDVDVKVAHFQEQVLKVYDGLRADMEIQKHKLQTLSEEVQSYKKGQQKEKNAL